MDHRPGDEIDPDTLCRAVDAVERFVASWPANVCRCPFPADTMEVGGPNWQGVVPDVLVPFSREAVYEATLMLVRLGSIVLVDGARS